uniref:Uncharacterized protein n=1 Tax=Lactuca sativa TaxID=4236 RepID=A0A9R1XDN7_LACSA|nr:hypothetical protein LSAT_V11C400192440 [Lactuca sativa]
MKLRPEMMKAVCLVVLFAISITSQARSIIQKPQPNPNFKINSTNHQVRDPVSGSRKFKTEFSLTSFDFPRMHAPVHSPWRSRRAVLPFDTLEIKSVSPSAMLTAIRFDFCKHSPDFKLRNKLEYNVYAPRIDDPSTRTFERCSGDTFEIYGPCTYQICYLYLYRSGYDGWKPERVDVYGYNTRAVSFYYNVWIPANIWYGFNYCSPYLSASK